MRTSDRSETRPDTQPGICRKSLPLANYLDGRMDGQTDGWMDGLTDGLTDRWIDGPTDGPTDKASYRAFAVTLSSFGLL